MPITGSVNTAELRASLARAEAKLTSTSLSLKIRHLRQSRSTDQLQQLQTDAIVDLYDAVREIQLAIWPMLALIPDTSGAREAAEKAAAGGSGSGSVNRSTALSPKAFVTR